MRRIQPISLTPWITRAAVQHGDALAAQLVQRLGVSRRRAVQLLDKLVALQWLVREGTPRKPHYRPGALRQVVQRYTLAGLQEDLPWRQDVAPFLQVPTEVQRMAQHAFTEILNNAIDHSGGTQVTVSVRQTPLQLQLLISDDGIGLFKRVAQSFAIDDPHLAMLELAKGKLTSAPDRHCGHGLFFSARLADVFDVHANGSAFQRRAWEERTWRAGRPAGSRGTSVYLAISLDTPRTLDAVLQAASAAGNGYDFSTTRVPLLLVSGGRAPDAEATLASRAEAKRALARLTQFRRAEIDFSGVAHIGHGFADEMFRFFAREHPQVELLPQGMSPQVAAMVASVRQQAA